MITFEQVQNWLGSDENFHLNEAIEVIKDIANGDYNPKTLKKDIEDYE